MISKQKETKMKLNLRFIIYSHPCPKKNVGLLVGLHLVEFSLTYLNKLDVTKCNFTYENVSKITVVDSRMYRHLNLN